MRRCDKGNVRVVTNVICYLAHVTDTLVRVTLGRLPLDHIISRLRVRRPGVAGRGVGQVGSIGSLPNRGQALAAARRVNSSVVPIFSGAVPRSLRQKIGARVLVAREGAWMLVVAERKGSRCLRAFSLRCPAASND